MSSDEPGRKFRYTKSWEDYRLSDQAATDCADIVKAEMNKSGTYPDYSREQIKSAIQRDMHAPDSPFDTPDLYSSRPRYESPLPRGSTSRALVPGRTTVAPTDALLRVRSTPLRHTVGRSSEAAIRNIKRHDLDRQRSADISADDYVDSGVASVLSAYNRAHVDAHGRPPPATESFGVQARRTTPADVGRSFLTNATATTFGALADSAGGGIGGGPVASGVRHTANTTGRYGRERLSKRGLSRLPFQPHEAEEVAYKTFDLSVATIRKKEGGFKRSPYDQAMEDSRTAVVTLRKSTTPLYRSKFKEVQPNTPRQEAINKTSGILSEAIAKKRVSDNAGHRAKPYNLGVSNPPRKRLGN